MFKRQSKTDPSSQQVVVEFDPDQWVNNLNRTALKKTIKKMENDKNMAAEVPIAVKAQWKEGVVTGVNGKLVCYAPPDIQMSSDGKTKGPSVNSYCPLIAGGCFVLILMMHATKKDYHFEEVTANMKTDADVVGFYKEGWAGMKTKDGYIVKHPWGGADGIRLGIVIRSGKSQDKLNDLADHANKHCPSSEMMKRDFPVEVDKFALQGQNDEEDAIDWDKVPVFYNMDKYQEIAKKDSHVVTQEANMTWHLDNDALADNTEADAGALMTFDFPQDSKSSLTLGFDPPIGQQGPYANPVQACFFGGLSSFMHTIACRIYAKGYKVTKIDGVINTKLNKRKVLGVEKDTWVFPVGASIEVDIVSNAPKELLHEIQMEAENMSPTMMNWREELPFFYGVARAKPRHKRIKPQRVMKDGDLCGSEGDSATGSSSASSSGGSSGGSSSKGIARVMKFFWKLSTANGAGP
ncbi:MAG: hypothetical protein SGILL_009053 [Bacillariaceae sp.]